MSELKLKDFDKERIISHYCKDSHDIDIKAIKSCWKFLQAATKVTKVIESHHSDHGISGGKFAVLITLYMIAFSEEKKEIIPSEISDNLHITRPTLTGLLDGLEKDGFVMRRSHDFDKRMFVVRLTAKGTQLMDTLVPKHYALLSYIFGTLQDDELETINFLMDKIEARIQEKK